MPPYDPNKKTLRHFQCRDFLWEIFEKMSQELECSIDYLVNEAMRQYAKTRNYGTSFDQGQMPEKPLKPTQQIPIQKPGVPLMPGKMPTGMGQTKPPGMPMKSGHMPVRQTGNQPKQMTPINQQMPPRVTPSSSLSSPSLSTEAPTGQGLPPGAPPLFVIFNGKKIPVNKQQFIIGRGTKTSDLPIKDGNISRKHAAIIFHNGVYYFKDLGSTNGIEFNGVKIDNKRIEEGDVYYLCDYPIKFTYH